MNRRQWRELERILALFTSDQVAMHLELLLLKAWLADHYRRLVELTAILEQADALMALCRRTPRPPFACGVKCMPCAARWAFCPIADSVCEPIGWQAKDGTYRRSMMAYELRLRFTAAC